MVKRKAVLYMIGAALAFTVLNSLIRLVDHFPTFQLVFFRSIGSVILCLSYLRIRKISPWGNDKGWLMIRAVIGFTSLFLFFWSLKLMPIGTAVSLRYTSPFFAAILAVLFLGERMRGIQWLFFALAFAGVILLKGFDTRVSPDALAIVLLSAFFSGCVYFIIRRIGVSEHPVVVVLYFMAVSSILAGLISIFTWTAPTGFEWLILGSLGIFGYIAQVFMTKGLQLEEASRIVPFKYVEVVFTLLAGWFFFGESQGIIAILAIAIIISALMGNVLVKVK